MMDEVTRNLIAEWRHFPEAWEIDVQGPSAFLRGLYDLQGVESL